MESSDVEKQEVSAQNCGAREDVASSAQVAIAALARGIVPHADLAFPWPPPSYVWPRRAAEDVLAHVEERGEKKWSARDRVLSLGSQALDEKLSGCFALGSLVEIVGQAGTGKTQLALTLAAETIIQLYNVHKPCTPCCGSGPLLPEFPDSAEEANEEAGKHSHNRDGEAHIQGSRRQFSNHQCPERDMKRSTARECKPAVVYYLHTEGAFPVKRLHEIVLHRQHRKDVEREEQACHCRLARRECRVCPVDTTDDAHTKLLMQRVFTEEVSSEEQLWSNLTRRLPRLTIHHRVALVVLDSIAAIFRPTALDSVSPGGLFDYSCVDMMSTQRRFNSSNHLKARLVDRASKLLRIGALLRRLCSDHDFCCLVLNQVSDTVKEHSPPCRNPRDYDISVARTGYLAPPTGNNVEGVHAVALSGKSTEDRLARICRQSTPCSADGRYIWNTRNSHGPVLESIGVQPSLGLTWGNCLNCRLLLHKMRANAISSANVYGAGGAGRTPPLLRRCRAIFGNDADISKDIIFTIDVTGVVEA